MVALGGEAEAAGVTASGPLTAEAAPPARRLSDYPAARALHDASSLHSDAEVRRYRAGPASPAGTGPGAWPWDTPLEVVLRRRGSVRDFAPEPIQRAQLAAALAFAARPIAADFEPSSALFGMVSAVDGLDPGAYRFSPPDEFELLRRGYLCA